MFSYVLECSRMFYFLFLFKLILKFHIPVGFYYCAHAPLPLFYFGFEILDIRRKVHSFSDVRTHKFTGNKSAVLSFYSVILVIHSSILYEEASIMNNHEENSNFKKPLDSHCVSKTECNIEGKIEQQCMLMSTTYGLNSSYTKKIHVGLMVIDGDELDFLPIVKLTSHDATGICFDMESWQKFQENMELISAYLSECRLR